MNGPVALLDLDGTLTDSRPGIIASLRAALRDLGHALDPDEDLSWMIGPPVEQTIGTLLGRWGDTREAEAVALYRRHYGATGMLDNAVYPGIAAALEGFVADGWTLFVATAKRTRYAVPILRHFGLAGHFRVIYGSEDGPRLDTKPVLLAHIVAEQGFSPARAVMIGDRHHDIQGAKANAMRSIGVAWGYGGAAELRDAGADAIAEAPADLPVLARALLG
jgi:phosphoglycolate phosphatase